MVARTGRAAHNGGRAWPIGSWIVRRLARERVAACTSGTPSTQARVGDQFAPDPRAARAYQKVNKVDATLTTFTGPLFRSMADGLQGLERTPGPGRR